MTTEPETVTCLPITPQPTPHDDLKPPTPDEIDTEIVAYKIAQLCAAHAKEALDAAKQKLVFMADSFGHRPAHAEQSLRLAGRRNTLTVTRGTTVTVNEQEVAEFERYLGPTLGQPFFGQLFAKTTKHTLVEGARDLLKKLTLPRRSEEKVLSLFGRCIDLKPKAATVKIEVIQPEKPARKPRTAKAAGKVAA
jgi:hypothetical protein